MRLGAESVIDTPHGRKDEPTVGLFCRTACLEHYYMERDAYDACTAYVRSFGDEHVAAGMDTICLRVDALTIRDWRLRASWRQLRSRPEHLAFRRGT